MWSSVHFYFFTERTSKHTDFHWNASLRSLWVFITWAVPGLAAFAMCTCAGTWLRSVPWLPGRRTGPGRSQRVWGKTSPGKLLKTATPLARLRETLSNHQPTTSSALLKALPYRGRARIWEKVSRSRLCSWFLNTVLDTEFGNPDLRGKQAVT